MRYTGEQLDTTGLYHLRARQYEPTTGRFTTTDPVTPDIEDPYVSAYIYANDRPTTMTDPTGEKGRVVGPNDPTAAIHPPPPVDDAELGPVLLASSSSWSVEKAKDFVKKYGGKMTVQWVQDQVVSGLYPHLQASLSSLNNTLEDLGTALSYRRQREEFAGTEEFQRCSQRCVRWRYLDAQVFRYVGRMFIRKREKTPYDYWWDRCGVQAYNDNRLAGSCR